MTKKKLNEEVDKEYPTESMGCETKYAKCTFCDGAEEGEYLDVECNFPLGKGPNKNGDDFSKCNHDDELSKKMKEEIDLIREHLRNAIHKDSSLENQQKQMLESFKEQVLQIKPLNVSISCEVNKEDPGRVDIEISGPENEVKKITGPHCRGIELEETDGWQKVGEISVDAGICWVGDPCYILPDKRGKYIDNPGLLYTDMLDAMFIQDSIEEGEREFPCRKTNQVHAFDHYPGNTGKGIVMGSGYGDGCYDVFVKAKKIGGWGRRITEMKVVFINENETEKGA